jgi:anti-sigma factor RsiW
MSRHLSIRDLEDIVDGTPAPAHVARCTDCMRRLAFLRAERELVRRAAARDDGPVETLWRGVQGRIARDRQRRIRVVSTAGLAAAAAAAMIVFLPRRISHERAGGSQAALDHAETEYLQAIHVLESRVEVRERTLSPSTAEQRRAARAQARAVISYARAPEPAGRIRQLEGYAAYLRSLRRELDETP